MYGITMLVKLSSTKYERCNKSPEIDDNTDPARGYLNPHGRYT